ncbi:hypothetical protein [Marinibactrum halimedae]|uniref:Uncharacterized protein n=1 Tax=Marinibactrum halimedae TaxID=1444977 RepID=A0AA37T9V2_9GAMM|nr:hypothetical protein [Marinibactrum halimedae]MCD9461192.1 hypothetical protein [Marinibactrum halimedae]GLS26185.1 hypothetical protein GCM10007877_19000 [Marinibactrum halimedae]
MVTPPSLIKPIWDECPLATFDLSGVELVFPLPKSAYPSYATCNKPNIDIHDPMNYIGNPKKGRYIPLIEDMWNYIAESSSLIAGTAKISMQLNQIHENANVHGPITKERFFKKWALYESSHGYIKADQDNIEAAIFLGKSPEDVVLSVYPKSTDELTVVDIDNTPKCFIKAGSPTILRLAHYCFIPITPKHGIEVFLSFDGFPIEIMKTEELCQEILDSFANEIFSQIRIKYSPEMEAEMKNFYDE